MTTAYVSAAYLLSSILSILSIRGLASPDTARRGNILGMLGMAVAISVTVYSPTVSEYAWMLGAIALGGIIGVWFALKVKMTALPQMIAAFNGLGGLSSVFIAAAEILRYYDRRARRQTHEKSNQQVDYSAGRAAHRR